MSMRSISGEDIQNSTLPNLESAPCTHDLHFAAEQGMPVYAECGGLMYLTKEINADKTYRMCGILPSTAEMTNRIQALGYVKGTGTGDSIVHAIISGYYRS